MKFALKYTEEQTIHSTSYNPLDQKTAVYNSLDYCLHFVSLKNSITNMN